MSHIFISYVEEDSSLVQEVAEGLEASGYKTWYYERDSVPGLSYLEQMGEAIDDAQAMVLVISPQSVTSRQVTTEVVRAHEQAKPFIPLLHGLSHAEFQERQSSWRQALGASTSISVSDDASQAARRIALGLKALGIEPELAPPLSSTSGVFVGREREVGELTAALEDALSGRGRIIMLVGEPGIGKTRTAAELATVAEKRGGQALWGTCHEEEGTPAYWPWVQAIRSYVRRQDGETLATQMGLGAADLAEMVSDIRVKLPDLEPRPAIEPQQARFRLFDSVASFLKSAANSQPLILVLEDLHWADKPSLALLEFIARELGDARLVVMGTYRNVELSRQHPLSQTLGELVRGPRFQQVVLRGLATGDVGRLIRVTTGTEPRDDFVEAMVDRTEGNPFFVTEVVRLLSEEGMLTPGDLRSGQGWARLIPQGVRLLIGRRLGHLSEECNQALSIASVIGREFGLEQVHRLTDDLSAVSGQALSEDRVLEVLEEATASGVLEEVEGAVGRYRFSHALIQQTLAGELSTTRRVRLHARVAAVLEQLYGDDAEANAPELAHHFAEAEASLGPEKLVHYSRIAGEQALAVYAWEEALAHFQRALAARESQPTDAESAAALAGLGRAQAATLERGQLQEAVESLRRAFDYYAQMGDGLRAVGTMLFHFPDVHGVKGLADLTQRAARLAPPDSRETGYLLSRYGMFVSFEKGDYKAAQEAFDRALHIARREKDSALEMQTLASAATVDYLHLHFQESLEKGLRAIELAQQMDDLQAQFEAREVMSLVLTMTGEPEDVPVHASEAVALAEKLGSSITLALALSLQTVLSSFRGDWNGVRDSSDKAMSALYLDYRFLIPRIWMEYQLGNFDQGAAYFDRLVPDLTLLRGNEAALVGYCARITGMHTGFEAVEAMAKTTLSSAATEPLRRIFWREALALIAAERRDPGGAVEQYVALRESGGMAPGLVGIAVDRLLGLLAHTTDQPDKASTHFEDALAFCRKAGYRPELAWSCHDYADTLLTQNGPGDHEKALKLLDESLAISTELGMRPLMERVAALQERAGSLPAKAPAYPDHLTEREG